MFQSFVCFVLEIGESFCKKNHLPLFGLQIWILAYWVFLITSVILTVSLLTVLQFLQMESVLCEYQLFSS